MNQIIRINMQVNYVSNLMAKYLLSKAGHMWSKLYLHPNIRVPHKLFQLKIKMGLDRIRLLLGKE